MRATITLLPGNAVGEVLCTVAEDILTEVSLAFGHTFSLVRDKIGEASISAYEADLTMETVETCRQSAAVLAGEASLGGIEELLLEMEVPDRVRTFPLSKSLSYAIIRAESLNGDVVNATLQHAFELARRENGSLYYVAPSGKARANWLQSITQSEKENKGMVALELLPPRAVRMLIEQPERIGVLVVPPYAGSMLNAMATSLSAEPGLLYDTCERNNAHIYAPVVPETREKQICPLGMVLSTSALLRGALHLERESDCVEAAVHNVLEAGWRTPDMQTVTAGQVIATDQLVRLIREQISLAGELLGTQGGIR